MFIAWQDSRNGNIETDAEDVYFASVGLDGRAPATAAADQPPDWALGVAGLALGMGLAMVAAWLLTRRAIPPPARS